MCFTSNGKRWTSPPICKERAELEEEFDDKARKQHRDHVQSFVAWGVPAEGEYTLALFTIEGECNVIVRYGKIPNFAGCPSTLKWISTLTESAKEPEKEPGSIRAPPPPSFLVVLFFLFQTWSYVFSMPCIKFT